MVSKRPRIKRARGPARVRPLQIQAAVSRASEEPVITAGAARIGIVSPDWPFIPPTSSIIDNNALPFIENICKRVPYVRPSVAEAEEMANYLALSTCAHVLDGWRYLSQAAMALLNGARSEALHLAYYAELRAALSILANSGVGILKSKHFILTHLGSVEWFEGGTHQVAWDALKEWTKKLPHAQSVVESFVAAGLTGDEWADACGVPGRSVQEIASHWIQNWSIDLQALAQDRDRRNEASYRPALHSGALKPLTYEELKFIRDINSACVPVGDGSFDPLDTALINDLCRSAFLLQHPIAPSSARTFWESVQHWLINDKGFTSSQAQEAISIIRAARRGIGGQILRNADINNAGPDGVFCRAFLLLRLASALHRRQWNTIRLRASSAVSAGWHNQLLFSYSIYSNLWGDKIPPSDYAIFNEDQVEAQEDLDIWHLYNPPTAFSAHKLWKDVPKALTQLCRFERIGVIAASL